MDEMQNFTPQTVAPRGVNAEMMVSRQAQEVQAAMVVAKRFPRDENASYARIMNACKRQKLAECAVYEYPRGGVNVTGPSIRLAEMMAQNWGNVDSGIMELERKNGESTVMAYCWDLETNCRQTVIFTVPHIRHTKNGDIALTDPRDIYEMVSNQGARRKRACILGIIPGDVVEAAVKECAKTLRTGSKEPLGVRVRKMLVIFKEEYGVPKESVEKYIGCKSDAFTEVSVVKLRGVYTALRDGRADREQYFDIPTADAAQEEETDEAPQVDEATGEVLNSGSEEKPKKTENGTRKVTMDDL